MSDTSISVVLPTYNRGSLLLDTLAMLIEQSESAQEILVMDQTEYSEGNQTRIMLEKLDQEGLIAWHRLSTPSIPRAMNSGLSLARSRWVLFLDDDIKIDKTFMSNLKAVLTEGSSLAYVGQVVQPWQTPNQEREFLDNYEGLKKHLDFKFNSDKEARIENCMAGNLCLNREAAKAAGGFDENFRGAAYRFETEFSKRFCAFHSTLIAYSPSFLINHLHAKKGGTRTHENFLTSSSPVHSEGDYYYALVRGRGWERVMYCASRLFGSTVARFYLFKPWYLPFRLLGEIRGLLSALKAKRSGQFLLNNNVFDRDG